MNSRLLSLFGCAVLSASLLAPAFANPKPGNKNNGLDDDIRKQDKALGDAKGNVGSATSQAKSAHEAFNKADAHFDRVKVQNTTTHNKVRDELDQTPAMTQARKTVEERKAAYEAAAAPLLAGLKNRSDYVSAVNARDEVERKLTAMKNGGYGDAATLAKAKLAATTNVRQIENSVTSADPKASAAHKSVEEAEARLREQCDKRDEAIKRDSRIVNSLKELEAAKRARDSAEDKYKAELKQLESARKHLAQAEHHKRELEQKRHQQQQQKNKPKGKK